MPTWRLLQNSYVPCPVQTETTLVDFSHITKLVKLASEYIQTPLLKRIAIGIIKHHQTYCSITPGTVVRLIRTLILSGKSFLQPKEA